MPSFTTKKDLRMDLKNPRSSDRVSLELTIEILATDAAGREFFDEGRTILVSRHGAKILFGRKLVPHQEITIRCIDSGQEAVAVGVSVAVDVAVAVAVAVAVDVDVAVAVAVAVGVGVGDGVPQGCSM